MPRSKALLIVLCAPMLLTAACARREPPAPQAPPVAVTPQHMQDHFSVVREIEDAVIRGDLEAARTPARQFVEHQEVTGAARTEKPLGELKSAAQTVASATDLEHAAGGAAAMAGACGRCHAASKAEPALPLPPARTARNARAQQMLEHQQAVDQMYRGLVVAVSRDWQKGAKALQEAPLRARTFKDIPSEIAAAETRFKELADRAAKAPDQATRISVYGSILGTCAQCHDLHARRDPGLAKKS